MAKKTKDEAKPEESLHQRAVKRYKELEDYWAENRKAAVTDRKFAAGDHWPEKVKAAREKKGRPCLVFDKIGQYVAQVVNDGRQNRPSIKYRPVDDKGDIKVADAFQGIARHILTASNADEAFDTALSDAATSGTGYFRVLTEWAHENAFEQDIRIKRVRNPLAVMLGPHQAADGSDSDDGFVVDDISREEFKRQWPKAEKANWQTDEHHYTEGWLTELTVRVCEYWYKVPTKAMLHLLSDGTTATDDEYSKDLSPDKPQIVRSREIEDFKVKFCRLSGAEILEEGDWLGRFIPIVPVYGTETDIEGKVIYSGLYRKAKDPQLLYDFSRSAFAERVALAPKAPFVAAQGQVEGHPEWNTANSENHAYLPYTPMEVGGTLLPMPQRIQASDVPNGFAQDAQMSEHDIQAALGMYNASLGAPSNEKSGKAIMARQREGDVATFHYHDNLNRGVRYLGRILLDLIPKIYDTKRVIRIVGESGDVEMAMVDPDLPSAYAKMPPSEGSEKAVPVFNLNAGRYDVDVSSGPSYTTKRQESADAMLELARNNPQYWNTHGDLIVKSQDWPNAEEFAERTMAIMPPELKAAIAKEESKNDEDGPSPEVMAIMEQAKMALQERDQQIEQMGGMLEQAKGAIEKAQEDVKNAEVKALAEAGLKDRELDLKEREVVIKERDSETKYLEAKAAAITAGVNVAEFDEEGNEIPPPPDPVAMAVLALAEAITQQTPQLVAAIAAPRVAVPERDPITGRVTHLVSSPAMVQ